MSKCEHGIKLNRTCLSCVQIERSAMVAITEPERDVLERLTFDLLSLKLLLRDDGSPKVSRADLEKFSKNVADATAEIKRLGKLVDGLHCTNVMLRAIAEAKPVRYQWRFLTTPGQPASTWFDCEESYYRAHMDDPKQAVRALIVKPTGGEGAD